jgi:adenylyltransferase/sulfurtransferase
MFSALSNSQFKNFKLRLRNPKCPACGTAEEKLGEIRDIDYVQFCGGPRPDWEKRGLGDGADGWRIHVKVVYFRQRMVYGLS